MLAQFRKCLALTHKGRRWKLGVIGILTLISSGLEMVSVALVLPFIAMVNNPDSIHSFALLERTYNALGLAGPRDFIIVCGLAFATLVALKNALFYALTRAQSNFSYGEGVDLSARLLRFYLERPYAEHLKQHSTEAVTTANIAVDQVFVGVLLSYVGAITDLLTIVGILTVLVLAEPTVTIAVIAVLGSMVGGMYLTMKRWMVRFGYENNHHHEQRYKILSQALHSMKEVKVLGRQQDFVHRFERVRTCNAKLNAHNLTLQVVPRLVIESLVLAGIVAMIVVTLIKGWDAGRITALLGLFAVSAFRLMPCLNRLLTNLNNIKLGAASVERVYEDIVRLNGQAMESGSGEAIRFEQSVRFNHVCFSYTGQTRPAVTGIDLTIGRGEWIGIIGSSGAGKSTLMDLLLGLLVPTSGSIQVDGHDIARNIESWQRQLGYVPQSIYVADESVRRNVAYGLDDASIDDACVRRALAMAQLTEVVAQLPAGLETMLGEHGARLSGGQRQRIGLARALYHNPQVLVLDEATSALDNETEHEVTAAIERLRGDKTIIVIAHRLSTVRHCDRLVMMANGRVAAAGQFDQLIAASEEFRSLVQLANLNETTIPSSS